MMEHVIPSTINHILDHYLFELSLPTSSPIIRFYSYFALTRGLIQVVHCGLVAINQAKNLYQRFPN
jgi:hypothetical protein